MQPNYRRAFPLILVTLCVVFFSRCIRKTQTPLSELNLNLYAGVENVVKLGQSEEEILGKIPWQTSEVSLSAIPDAQSIGFTRIVQIGDLGMRVYFKEGRANLIEIQEPFKGRIVGKKLAIFSFSLPPNGDTWRDELLRLFGHPQSEATGGRFGSSALFYPWGDISYNRMGPNGIALHRNPEIAKYRQKHFGRELQLFSGSK